MKGRLKLTVFLLLFSATIYGQDKKKVIQDIVQEANDNSQLESLAYALTDLIGPRLVGTPQMQKAHDWAVVTYENWGIDVRNEQWGSWRGWERGVTHIDLIHPRVVSLEGMQLAWSPATQDGPKTGGLVIIPELEDSAAFKKWLPQVKDKFVLVSMMQPSGRPDYNLKEYATPEL